jgi:hypothetical protein
MRRLIGRRDFRCGAFSGFDAHSCQARFTSMNGHHQATSVGPKSAMCGRLRFGKSFLHGFAALVVAAMCSAF